MGPTMKLLLFVTVWTVASYKYVWADSTCSLGEVEDSSCIPCKDYCSKWCKEPTEQCLAGVHTWRDREQLCGRCAPGCFSRGQDGITDGNLDELICYPCKNASDHLRCQYLAEDDTIAEENPQSNISYGTDPTSHVNPEIKCRNQEITIKRQRIVIIMLIVLVILLVSLPIGYVVYISQKKCNKNREEVGDSEEMRNLPKNSQSNGTSAHVNGTT